ncbi:MAG: pilin [Patescibacteria group bacterium]|jgi:hypothetical protein
MKRNKKITTVFVLLLLFLIFPLIPSSAAEQCCVCQTAGSDKLEAVGAPDANGTCTPYLQGRTCPKPWDGSCSSKEVQDKINAANKSDDKEETKPLITPSLPTIGNIISLDSSVEVAGEAPNRYYYIPWIAQMVGGLYKFGVGAAAVLAVVMIVIGGFIWMTSGGDSGRITAAKGYIIGSIVGLILALGSYSILYLVNPELVYLRPIKVPYVEPVELSGILCPTEAPNGEKTFTYEQTSKEIPAGENLICGTPYIIGASLTSGDPCVGSYCTGGNQMCLPAPSAEKSYALKMNLIAFSCQASPELACNRIDDSGSASNWVNLPPPNPTITDEESQEACEIINQLDSAKAKGMCVFMDANGSADGCAWCSNEEYDKLDPNWIPTQDMQDNGCQDVDIDDYQRTRDKTAACQIRKCIEMGYRIE